MKRQIASIYEAPPDGISHVLPIHLYNLPIYEGFMIIDVRPQGVHQKNHIASSVNLPHTILNSLKDNERDEFLLGALKKLIEVGLYERSSPVILYGDESNECQQAMDWLSKRLLKLDEFPLPIPPNSNESLDCFYKSLRKNQRVWILEGGFNYFQLEFPMLCHSDHEIQRDLISLPFMAAPGLFLGSRAVNDINRRFQGRLSLDLDTLKALGITHVVVNGGVDLSVEDSHGLSCLSCGVSENDDNGMIHFLPAIIEFIESARKSWNSTGSSTNSDNTSSSVTSSAIIPMSSSTTAIPAKKSRVMVQFYGRSRSAGIIAAWAIEILGFSVEKAVRFIKDRCFYNIDPSLMFLGVLQKYSEEKSRKMLT